MALIECSTKKEAAKKAGISDRTLMSYLQDDEFTRQLNAAYSDMIADATRLAQKRITSAINVLHEIAENHNANDYARVNACKVLIESCLKLTEMNNILSRLEALENATRKP